MKRALAISGAVVALGLAIAAGLIALDLYTPYSLAPGSVVLVVEPHMRAPDVVNLLVSKGIVEHRWPFLCRYAVGRVRRRLIKSGEYNFEPPLRPIDVYWKLVEGEVYLHPVVIPEGSDRFDMARIFKQDLDIDPDAFVQATASPGLIQDLDPNAQTLEGYLYPDTYRFPRGAGATRVVQAMVARFRHVLETRFHAEMAGPDPSGDPAPPLHEVVTLASLVEKETPDPLERPIVAAVFRKRLEKGWQLGCDPTVIYAARLNHRKLEHPPGPITRSDLAFESPYNTYLHKGLPPGPIASPGETAMRAVFHPAPLDFLYFVSNNHGGHQFARTLAEHERNVARYRRLVAESSHSLESHAGSPRQAGTGKGRGESRRPDNSTERAKRNQ